MKYEYFDFNALFIRFMKILLDLMSGKLGPSFNKIKNNLYKNILKDFTFMLKRKNSKIQKFKRWC